MQKLISEFIRSMTGYENQPSNCDSSVVFDCELVVVQISSYLNDEELLNFFQLNKSLRDISQKNNILQVRLLKIKLKKTESILTQIGDGTYKRTNQSCKTNKNYPQERFMSTSQNISFIISSMAVRRNNPKINQNQEEQKQEQIVVSEAQPIQLAQSWPAAKPKQNDIGNSMNIDRPYNTEELRDIINEVKQIMLFNPQTAKQGELQYNLLKVVTHRPDNILHLKSQGQVLLNSISKNFCPVVNYKRFKQALKRVYTQPWDQDVITKPI